MAVETVILRPSSSSDVSIANTQPSGYSIEDVFLLISEEVSDGSTTYISFETGSFVTLGFGSVSQSANVLSAKMFFVYAHSQDAEAEFVVSGGIFPENGGSVSIGETGFNLPTTGSADTFATIVVELAGFPNAISQKSGELKLTIDCKNRGATKDYPRLTQLYLEIEYETEGGETVSSGIHIKQNGVWAEASQMFHKVNGAWVEITAEECKTILQNNAITSS